MIEAILFTAPEPLSITDLAQTLERKEAEINALLEAWGEGQDDRGIRLQRLGKRVQLVSAPEAAPYIERLLGLQLPTRLSSAALETLAIIAYRQPTTRPEIEALRGVDCSGVLRTLIHMGLIEEAGRASSPGRPFLYTTTFDFLRHFGLQSLEELPPLPLPEQEAS